MSGESNAGKHRKSINHVPCRPAPPCEVADDAVVLDRCVALQIASIQCGVSTDPGTGRTRRPAPRPTAGSRRWRRRGAPRALGRGDLAVIGILVSVMEIPGAQHAAVDHHRPADREALFRSVVLVQRIDSAGLGANDQRDEQSHFVHGQDPGTNAGRSGCSSRRVGGPYGVDKGVRAASKQTLTRARGGGSEGGRLNAAAVAASYRRATSMHLQRQRVEIGLQLHLLHHQHADRISQDESLELVGIIRPAPDGPASQ